MVQTLSLSPGSDSAKILYEIQQSPIYDNVSTLHIGNSYVLQSAAHQGATHQCAGVRSAQEEQ